MTDIESKWEFSKSFDPKRKTNLEKIDSFQKIIDRIQDEATVTWFDICAGKDLEVKKCFRPEFKLKVQAETFDLFFNSPHGYRAQYLKNPEEGQEQNGILINTILPKLLAYAKDKKTSSSMTMEQIKTSLNYSSARIWISEEGTPYRDKTPGYVEEILVPGWLKHARETNNMQARDGIRAPEGTVLVVIGAFLDKDGEEVIHPDKIRRHLEIQRYGFT